MRRSVITRSGPESGAGGQRRGGALDRFDFIVLGAQPDGQKPQQSRVVVDHQDPRLALLGGSRRANRWLQSERQGGGGGVRVSVQCGLSDDLR